MKQRVSLVLAIFFVAALLAGGCGPGSNGAANPEKVVQDFWSAFQSGDFEQAAAYLSEEYRIEFMEDLEDEDFESEAIRDFFKVMMGTITLSVSGHSIDGDSAVVEVEMTHPDFEELMGVIMGKMMALAFSGELDEDMTEEEGMELFIGLFVETLDEVESTETTNSEVPLILEDGRWKIDGEVVPEFGDDLDLFN